jgi:glycine/D-amino acid oxidase-like deaminating enzyme
MLNLPDHDESYWLDDCTVPTYPELNDDIEVDVAVVGGGIAGLSAAYLCKEAGLRVAVLEKSNIACGTTGNTTGKLTAQHGLSYKKLCDQQGLVTAKLYGLANQEAISDIEKVIKKEKIKCSWKKSSNYVYTLESKDIKLFKEEAKAAQKIGLPASFEMLTSLPFKVAGTVKFANQAHFNAAQYCSGLAAKIDGQGSYVFEKSRVITIHDGQTCKLRTKNNILSAKKIIVATNVPTFPLMARSSYCVLEYPQSSYLIAVKSAVKFSGMYISVDPKEYSILPLGDKNGTILVGGEGHIRGAKLNKKVRYHRLAEYAAQRLEAKSVKFMWHAWDYHGYDDIPLAGKMYPWSKNLYVISAFKKWGLSNSMVTAKILRDTVLGLPNELINIYYPHRASAVKAIPRVFVNYAKGG